MYPSTNPFAYGNQPLSVLEESQMIAKSQQTSLSAFTDTLHVPTSNREAFTLPVDNFDISAFGAFPPPGMNAQQRHGAASMPQDHPTHVPTSQPTVAQDTGNTNMYEGFWPQMDGGRTGLTPGVNLDELFGADGGWNPGYMDQA